MKSTEPKALSISFLSLPKHYTSSRPESLDHFFTARNVSHAENHLSLCEDAGEAARRTQTTPCS